MRKEVGLVVDLNQMESSANKLNEASPKAMNQPIIQAKPYVYGYDNDNPYNNQHTQRRKTRGIDATSVVPRKAPNDGNNSGNKRRRGRESREIDTSQM